MVLNLKPFNPELLNLDFLTLEPMNPEPLNLELLKFTIIEKNADRNLEKLRNENTNRKNADRI